MVRQIPQAHGNAAFSREKSKTQQQKVLTFQRGAGH